MKFVSDGTKEYAVLWSVNSYNIYAKSSVCQKMKTNWMKLEVKTNICKRGCMMASVWLYVKCMKCMKIPIRILDITKNSKTTRLCRPWIWAPANVRCIISVWVNMFWEAEVSSCVRISTKITSKTTKFGSVSKQLKHLINNKSYTSPFQSHQTFTDPQISVCDI